jgi:hypothetical protein
MTSRRVSQAVGCRVGCAARYAPSDALRSSFGVPFPRSSCAPLALRVALTRVLAPVLGAVTRGVARALLRVTRNSTVDLCTRAGGSPPAAPVNSVRSKGDVNV